MEPGYYTFEAYGKVVSKFAKYPKKGSNVVYPAMGCAGEAGEVSEKVKKHWRATGRLSAKGLSPEARLAILKELGDNLWYINQVASELGSSLREVANINIVKLTDRNKRSVVIGEGDDR